MADEPQKPYMEGPMHSTHPVIDPELTFASVTDKISSIVLTRRTSIAWFFGFAISFALFQLMLLAITNLVFVGIGLWGVNVPVAWGVDILNFVWWIGIGHAGTLISAILLLLRQQWRTSINRFAEAMTFFAVAQAGMYPIFHLGRPWLAYWLFPYPNTMGIWPQFRSPLMWDVFAVSTYATVSAMFWFVGLIPDFATLRDRARSKPFQLIYGLLAMGWRGSARHWHRYETAYLLLAGLATPLVLSVHTIVSFDFAVGIIPGWHATIFPPYFVAGAIYAGFRDGLVADDSAAKVLRSRRLHHHAAHAQHGEGDVSDRTDRWLWLHHGSVLRLVQREQLRTLHDLEPHARTIRALLLGADPVQYHYATVLVVEEDAFQPVVLWIISFIVSIGMWLERFVIVVTSFHRDFLPSSWGMYQPTMWDWSMFIGTIGFFFTLLFLFIRFLPMISIFEMRTILPEAEVDE